MTTESEIPKHRKSTGSNISRSNQKSKHTNINMKNVLYNMILLLAHKHTDIHDYTATALSVGK